MTRVLLIGSGQRAQSVILPALWHLRDEFELLGVASRSKKQLSLFDGLWQIWVTDSLKDFDFRGIDVVIVAITLENVPIMIDELLKYPVSHITLMLDTPVLPHGSLDTLKKFRNFKRVLVLEDNLYLSLYREVKREIDSGKIGKLRKIIFWHSGYRYHALAVLRMLTGARYIKKIKLIKLPAGETKREIRLPRGMTAEIIEPRDYQIGRFIVEGERGKLEYDLKDFGDMTEMKIAGLAALLKKAKDNSLDFDYSPEDAIYDNLVLKISDKLGFFLDVSLGQKTIFSRLVLGLGLVYNWMAK